MDDEIKELMAEMSDRELLEAIEKKCSDYTPDALEAGILELRRRGIHFDETAALVYIRAGAWEQSTEKPVELVDFKCAKCGGAMVQGRLLLGELGWDWHRLSGRPNPPKQVLSFSRESGTEDPTEILETAESRPAQCCIQCRVLTVEY